MDNDIYGHVNNVNYYNDFDTAVNQHLIERGVLDIHDGEVIGYVVETACNYFRLLAFPDGVAAGLCVARVGNSSVRYKIGLFRNVDEEIAAAGHFVHVYVDRKSDRPVPVPEEMRQVLAALYI